MFRINELLSPAAFPHEVLRLELRETHVSWVVLTGRFVYKIKKPVQFDFVDASTVERRAALCATELQLNQRFAPDLYLDVVPITCEANQLRVGGSGSPVEYAVRMHQFDPDQQLEALLERGSASLDDMGALALLLADLHQRAAVAAPGTPYGGYGLVRAQILGNLDRVGLDADSAAEDALQLLAGHIREHLARLQPTITGRKETGQVRDCHGDLHAGNIVRWQRRWVAFDRLEFDPALRWIDVISDNAFLYMDLVARQREDLACEFLSRYLEKSGDYAGLRLLPLYAAHRALIRAKVAALRAVPAPPAVRGALRATIAAKAQLAARFMSAKPPALIIMHGVSASGKSWLSQRLVSGLHAIRVRSDLERKRLAGVPPLSRREFGVGEGDYSAISTQLTYDRLLRCADAGLGGSCGIIVDAAFLQASQRAAFRDLAIRHGCPFLIVLCEADPEVLKARMDRRTRARSDPSEASPEVLEHQLRNQEPLDPWERSHAVEIDTGRPDSAAAAVAAISTRLQMARDVGR